MIICFGQQPCGIFPKRFLAAKFQTAKRLQKEMGEGTEIVFFYHDADHDPRETKTTLRHIQSQKPLDYNFEFDNKIQRKFSPMYLKRIPAEWHKKMAHTLPNYVSKELTDIFTSTPPTTVGDFCLEIYRKMGLLEGVQVIRSGDPAIRNAACDIPDYFVDIPYQNEIVRARLASPSSNAGILPAPSSDVSATQKSLQLHEGGPNFITLPFPDKIEKSQISPTRDTRLKWMQSVIHCTHYIAGAGEQQYLVKTDAPEIQFLDRDPIDRLDEAWTELSP